MVLTGGEIIEAKIRSWDLQPYDTQDSFMVFSQYYLTQDAPRNLQQAFTKWLADRNGISINEVHLDPLPQMYLAWAQGVARPEYRNMMPRPKTWLQRAEEYDKYLFEIAKANEEKSKIEARKLRRELLDQAVMDVKDVMADMLPSDPKSVRAAFAAFSAVMEQSRKEYDDMPTPGGQKDGGQQAGIIPIAWTDPINFADTIGVGADELPEEIRGLYAKTGN